MSICVDNQPIFFKWSATGIPLSTEYRNMSPEFIALLFSVYFEMETTRSMDAVDVSLCVEATP